jgi:hypothetical protein
VPETEGQLKDLYQFTRAKTGAAIQTTLAIAAGPVKSSSSSSGSGSCESASKKQRTADTRDVTYLEAAAFLTGDKTDVPYGADALKEQQLYKLAKVAKAAVKVAKSAVTAAAQAAKEAAKKAAEKAKEAKEAEVFTCRDKGCNRPYTDATSRGAKTKKNCSYCSMKCREAPSAGRRLCEHRRQPSRCKDCGTGLCLHRRRKSNCKDCGTGLCLYRRQKSNCKDCGTGLYGTRTANRQ